MSRPHHPKRSRWPEVGGRRRGRVRGEAHGRQRVAVAGGKWIRLVAVGCALLFAALPGSARAFDDNDVSAMVGHAHSEAEYPGSGGVWIGRDREVSIDGDANVKVEEHLLARIFDPAWGARLFSPYRRVYDASRCGLTVERARVWRSRTDFVELSREAVMESLAVRGARVPSADYLRCAVVRFPDLKSGEVVELRLRWDLPFTRNGPSRCWGEETFGAEDPVVEQRMVLRAPTVAPVAFTVVGRPLNPAALLDGSTTIRTWMAGDLPPLHCRMEEGPLARFPQPPDSAGPGVTRILFSNANDWALLSADLGDECERFGSQLSGETDRMVREATAGAENAAQRAQALTRYVQTSVRTLPVSTTQWGFSPAGAAGVAADRAGTARDKACLLVFLLRSAGVPALPVWVRTRGDRWDPDFACPAQLDQLVVLSPAPGGRDLWLDPIGGEKPLPAGRGLILCGSDERWRREARVGLVPFPGILPSGAPVNPTADPDSRR